MQLSTPVTLAITNLFLGLIVLAGSLYLGKQASREMDKQLGATMTLLLGPKPSEAGKTEDRLPKTVFMLTILGLLISIALFFIVWHFQTLVLLLIEA